MPAMPVKDETGEYDELLDIKPQDDTDSDLSDDDASYGATPSGSVGRPRARRPNTKVLELGLILKAPRAAQLSTKTIYDMVKDDVVDLEPEYQRGVVWTADKQSAVIESIMRHYYVPPVLLSMQKNDDPTAETQFVCIDGKQRISSVCNFFDNHIPVKEPVTGRKFWFKEDLSAGKTPALTPAQRRKFENEQLTIVEFEGLSEETERDMFSRVQMGVTLSSAEKLGAHLGPWPDYIRQMVKRFLDPTPSLVHEPDGKPIIAVNRGKDYLFMAQMALLIVHDKVDTYVPSAYTIDTFLKTHVHDGPSPQLRRDLQRTLERYMALANHRKYGKCIKAETKQNRLGYSMSKPLAPAEFVYIGLLIYKFPTATVSQLYKLVQGLKAEIRPQFKDVMFNSSVAGAIRRYINSATLPDDNDPDLTQETPSTNGHGKKRSRGSNTLDEEDEDEQPLRHRAHARLETNPEAGLFRGSSSEGSSRNPLTNMSPAPIQHR